MRRIAGRLAAVTASPAMMSIGLVVVPQAASAQVCEPAVGTPKIYADGRIHVAGRVFGSCPNATYNVGLYKKQWGVGT